MSLSVAQAKLNSRPMIIGRLSRVSKLSGSAIATLRVMPSSFIGTHRKRWAVSTETLSTSDGSISESFNDTNSMPAFMARVLARSSWVRLVSLSSLCIIVSLAVSEFLAASTSCSETRPASTSNWARYSSLENTGNFCLEGVLNGRQSSPVWIATLGDCSSVEILSTCHGWQIFFSQKPSSTHRGDLSGRLHLMTQCHEHPSLPQALSHGRS